MCGWGGPRMPSRGALQRWEPLQRGKRRGASSRAPGRGRWGRTSNDSNSNPRSALWPHKRDNASLFWYSSCRRQASALSNLPALRLPVWAGP